MPLVTPFDASFWSTAEKAPPPLTHEQKQGRFNEKNNGSATVERVFDEYGQVSYHSSVTGLTYPTAAEAVAAETQLRNNPDDYWLQMGLRYNEASAGGAPPANTPSGTVNTGLPESAVNLMQIPQAPNFFGPTPTQAPAVRGGFTREVPGSVALPPSVRDAFTMPTNRPATPAVAAGMNPPVTPKQLEDRAGVGPGTSSQTPAIPGATDPTSTPPPAAPVVDRARIDAILNPLTGYESDIYALSQDNTGLSLAEAQLNKAHELATQRSRDELAANQSGAIGIARGARNRGDRALLERQAIGEQAYLGSQQQRQQKNADDQLGLDLAIVRANEENADRNFKLDALKTAGSLGLNRAALEVDIGKADQAASTNYLNQQFEQLRTNKVLSEQQYEAVLDFTKNNLNAVLDYTKAMAAIQYQYDQLSVQDQNEADALLMQKYGIDKQTAVALKQIKEANKFHWDQFLTNVIGAAVGGGTEALATTALKD